MSQIINILYLIIISGFLIISVFILYHIAKYSFNKQTAFLMFVIFSAGLVILMSINFYLFANTNIAGMFSF